MQMNVNLSNSEGVSSGSIGVIGIQWVIPILYMACQTKVQRWQGRTIRWRWSRPIDSPCPRLAKNPTPFIWHKHLQSLQKMGAGRTNIDSSDLRVPATRVLERMKNRIILCLFQDRKCEQHVLVTYNNTMYLLVRPQNIKVISWKMLLFFIVMFYYVDKDNNGCRRLDVVESRRRYSKYKDKLSLLVGCTSWCVAMVRCSVYHTSRNPCSDLTILMLSSDFYSILTITMNKNLQDDLLSLLFIFRHFLDLQVVTLGCSEALIIVVSSLRRENWELEVSVSVFPLVLLTNLLNTATPVLYRRTGVFWFWIMTRTLNIFRGSFETK
jgi:hypothetical protein